MLVEALVFGGQDGLAHALRYVRNADRSATLFAEFSDQQSLAAVDP